MMATLIVITILIVVADNIINSMVHSRAARNIIKTVLVLCLIQTAGWVGLIAIVGYGVARSKRAQTAIKNYVHNLLTR